MSTVKLIVVGDICLKTKNNTYPFKNVKKFSIVKIYYLQDRKQFSKIKEKSGKTLFIT